MMSFAPAEQSTFPIGAVLFSVQQLGGAKVAKYQFPGYLGLVPNTAGDSLRAPATAAAAPPQSTT